MSGRSRSYRRLVIVADTERYSSRSSVLQHEAQRAFDQALTDAARVADVDRGNWRRQPSGDGELAVLPADVDEPILLSAFLPAIDTQLRRYNADRADHARIRIRVAVHQGLIFVDSRSGFAGEAVNTAARLVDAPLLKAAFTRFPHAVVACIVSDGIYRDIVRGGYDGIRPERFRRIRVDLPEKNFTEEAWIHVLGEDVTSLDPEQPHDVGAQQGESEIRRPRTPSERGGGISVGDVDNRRGQVAIGHGASASGGTRRAR